MSSATASERRLPVIEMLGRIYSNAHWEALCNRCGECCYESEWKDNRWVSTGVPCRYLDTETKHCKVYSCRFEAEPQCNAVTPAAVLQGMLPASCSYADELEQVINEDYCGRDPRLRGNRKQNKGARTRKGRARRR